MGRSDLGSLEIGKRADIAAYPTKNIVLAGAWDLVAGLLFCAPLKAAYTIVEGRIVVQDSRLTTIDLEKLLATHSNLTRQLINSS